ncbi:hypothetical protein PUR49_21880 [Streptomyces sp. BE147]|uniref:hypothetical protein n=1 Tax=Streptomyces sp. BE147 TaxID=3002524 RepID=UPI002E767ADC|nr:hypothetical protein [Streptomyces sp. BE147]MEE1739140.1 hypothetical protein [Streptomyces sp. BE147]
MITAVATIAAAVIAAVAVSGGDSGPEVPSSAVSPETSATASAPPGGPKASTAPSDPPVDRLPSGAADTPTPDAPPRVIASPDMAAEGAVVTLKVSGFAPGEQVRISFQDTSPQMEVDLRNVTAGPDGSSVAEVRVPKDRGNGFEQSKFRAWSVDDVDTDNTADTPFTYID